MTHIVLHNFGEPGVLTRVRLPRFRVRDEESFSEGKHPRGQPGNAGQFAAKPGGSHSGNSRNSESSTQKAIIGASAAPPGKITAEQRRAHVDSAVNVHGYLRQVAGLSGRHSKESFVLKNGLPFVPNEKTYEGPRGEQKMCFMNATQAVLENPERTYVEGYVTVHGVPIEHAWTMDATGQIYDPTLTKELAEGVSGYYGVPFKTDYVLKSALKNKVYGLLGHKSKTRMGLMAGSQRDFKEEPNVDVLSDEVVADRLAVAEGVVHSIGDTSGIDTPERHALRKKVADDLYGKDLDKRKRNREATIILGLPGAGKSTFANPLLSDGALEIEGDNAKALLPEFGAGEGAFAVHEEASSIMRDVLKRAIGNGDNLVWPRIDSPDKMDNDVKSLTKAGYSVNVKYINTSLDQAVESAVKRFLKNGRYVSPLNIVSYGDAPQKAYEAAVMAGATGEAYKRGHKGGFEKIG